MSSTEPGTTHPPRCLLARNCTICGREFHGESDEHMSVVDGRHVLAQSRQTISMIKGSWLPLVMFLAGFSLGLGFCRAERASNEAFAATTKAIMDRMKPCYEVPTW